LEKIMQRREGKPTGDEEVIHLAGKKLERK